MPRLIYSAAINAARMDVILNEVGQNPIMRMFGLGAGEDVPPTCESADVGFVIAEGADPSQNWLGAPSTTKTPAFVARANVWNSWELELLDSGLIRYVRIYDSAGVACHVQAEVKDLSQLLPPAGGPGPDPETGVFGGEKFEPGYLYVDGALIDPAQVGQFLLLDEMCITAGNQARFADVP
mgnify:FL=1